MGWGGILFKMTKTKQNPDLLRKKNCHFKIHKHQRDQILYRGEKKNVYYLTILKNEQLRKLSTIAVVGTDLGRGRL